MLAEVELYVTKWRKSTYWQVYILAQDTQEQTQIPSNTERLKKVWKANDFKHVAKNVISATHIFVYSGRISS